MEAVKDLQVHPVQQVKTKSRFKIALQLQSMTRESLIKHTI
jgi:hypothetical protein